MPIGFNHSLNHSLDDETLAAADRAGVRVQQTGADLNVNMTHAIDMMQETGQAINANVANDINALVDAARAPRQATDTSAAATTKTSGLRTLAGAAGAAIAAGSLATNLINLPEQRRRAQADLERQQHSNEEASLRNERSLQEIRQSEIGRMSNSVIFNISNELGERERTHVAIACSDSEAIEVFQTLIAADTALSGRIGKLVIGVSLQRLTNAMEDALQASSDAEKPNEHAYIFLSSTVTPARQGMVLHNKIKIGPHFSRYGRVVGEVSDNQHRHALAATSTAFGSNDRPVDLYKIGSEWLSQRLLYLPLHLDHSQLVNLRQHWKKREAGHLGAPTGVVMQAGTIAKTGAGLCKLVAGGKCVVGIFTGYGILLVTGWAAGKGLSYGWKAGTPFTSGWTYLYCVEQGDIEVLAQVLEHTHPRTRDYVRIHYNKSIWYC